MNIGYLFFFFFQAEDGIRGGRVPGVQTCALPISSSPRRRSSPGTPRCPPRRVRNATSRPIAVSATAPSSTQTQVGVVLALLSGDVVVVGTTIRLVVVC